MGKMIIADFITSIISAGIVWIIYSLWKRDREEVDREINRYIEYITKNKNECPSTEK